MKSLIVFASCVYLMHVSRCFVSSKQFKLDGDSYVANLTYHPETDKISIHVEVLTLGWIAFGFAETAPNDMKDYDVIVGGYANGKGYINDFNTEDHERPPVDDQQDYNLTDAKEDGSKTILTIERYRVTGDSKDVQLEPGVGVYLVWAYRTGNDAVNPQIFPVHSQRGFSAQKHVIVPMVTATTASMATATTASMATAPTASMVTAPTASMVTPTKSSMTPSNSTAAPTILSSKGNFVVWSAVVNVVLSFLFVYL